MLEYNLVRRAGVAQVTLGGALTIEQAGELAANLRGLPAGPAVVQIAFAGVTAMDTAVLQVLIAAQKMFAARGGSLRLVAPAASEPVRRLLERAGLVEFRGELG